MFKIAIAIMILISLNVNAEVTKAELEEALIESTILLEEQTILNNRLQNDIEELNSKINTYKEQVTIYQQLVNDWSEPVTMLKNLIPEFSAGLSEIENSFKDYQISVENEITAYRQELRRQRLFTYVSIGFGSGALAGNITDNTIREISFGVSAGFLLFLATEYLPFF